MRVFVYTLGLLLLFSLHSSAQNGVYVSRVTHFSIGEAGELKPTEMLNLIYIDIDRNGVEAYGKIAVSMVDKDGSADLDYYVYGIPSYSNLENRKVISYKASLYILGQKIDSYHILSLITDNDGTFTLMVTNLRPNLEETHQWFIAINKLK